MTSTNIYTDQKNYPYVYRLDNLQTKEFYIGYRKANLVPAERDLGTDYFTSAPAITEKFNEFQVTIIAQFFDANDAYDHEQYLIHCDWYNPLMLNESCYHGKQRFNFTDKSHSEETKAKISAANKGKSPTEETRAKISASLKGKPSSKKGKSISAETRAKISAGKKGKPQTAQHIAKRSASQKGTIHTKEHNKKLSVALTGRMQTKQHITNNSNAQKRKFLSIIETKKSYNKKTISRFFPEFKQFYP